MIPIEQEISEIEKELLKAYENLNEVQIEQFNLKKKLTEISETIRQAKNNIIKC